MIKTRFKFELGREYVLRNPGMNTGTRVIVERVNDWGAAFLHIEGRWKGQYASLEHGTNIWVAAPEKVERWIVESGEGSVVHCTAADADHEALYHRSRGQAAIVNGPFICEKPYPGESVQ